MDSNRIKRLATGARASLMAGVSASLERVLAPDSPEALAHPNEVAELREVARTDERGLVERVAYTWFNRLCALRFMDVRGYTEVPVVSPREGRTLPAMLDDARRGTFPGYVPQAERQRIASLLSEGSSSANPLGEAFVALLLAACDSWAKPMPMLFGADVRTRAAMRLLAPADLLSEGSVLARVREGMDEGDCQDVEVMGWLYQYYIAERKDEVFEGFRHSKKAGPDELGPATQLFTPSWIVRYMVENSLGRLWMLNFPSSRLRERMDYYIEPEGEVENFIRIGSPEEITLCDPACGSGHILVYAFDLLFDMYLEEGYRAADIPALILSKNLSGMEIDSRAAEIASFALEMKARERDDDFFSRGVNDDITVLEPVAFEPAETASLGLLAGNARLLDAFSHLGEVGSLYVPDPTDSVLVGSAIDSLRARDDMESAATLGKLELMATSLEALSRTFDAVVANPPYMGSKNMSPWMSSWVKDNYPDEKSDLFSAFILRNTFFCKQDGELGFMTPFVWMFISAYEKLRNLLINQGTITSLIQLEYSGFSGATVPVCTFTLHNGLLKNYRGGYVRLANFVGPAVQQPKALEAIRNHGCGWFYRCDARSFKDIPGSPVAYWASLAEKSSFINGKLLKQVVPTHAGISTGDNNAFLRLWQEVSARDISIFGGKNYSPHIKGGEYRKWFGNREYILKYDSKSLERMGSLPGFRHDGNQFYFKPMISWTKITSSSFHMRYFEAGFSFDSAAPAIIELPNSKLIRIMALLNSSVSSSFLSYLNPTLNYPPGPISNIPVLPSVITNDQIFEFSSSCIRLAKCDYDSFETSWDFQRHPLLRGKPLLADDAAEVEAEWQERFDSLKSNEEELNRIFAKIYGLEGEVPIEVPDDKVSVHRFDRSRETRLLVSYAIGCMFGRYSLDVDGLVLADQGSTLEDYLDKVPSPTFMPDEDGILPVTEGEWFEDDAASRFSTWLRAAFGEEHFQENLRWVEESLGTSVRAYLAKPSAGGFYADHCKTYSVAGSGKRPIYWMFSSPKNSFNALVHMHRYDEGSVSRLLTGYVRELRRKLEAQADVLGRSSTAKDQSNAARYRDMAAELAAWEHDVLYDLAQEHVSIDLDDGVKVNYAKFAGAVRKI